ncbi:histidine kinase [Algoriphagus sp. D3-2-R+10]|uniref:sensor histidine kinase n=1 Tax=Algoriphagus aurantiacus TaxID=3103948 RepID=UPI002B389DC2|nr:histidine kinase [Algoriphagus sp. D3-2-R+10]MEB2774217.1 histidine kinase [Algoriphagus sp. D3-2-R+10]
MGKSPNNYIWWHVIGVFAFLMLPIVLYPHPPEVKNFIFTAPTVRDFIANLLMVTFFYINYFYLIPIFFEKKKYSTYVLIILVSFGMIIMLPSMLTGYLPWMEQVRPMPRGLGTSPERRPDFMNIINNHVLLYLSVVLLSILLRIREQLFVAENTKSKAELNSLKSQVNPHFLFNTLNSIYGMAVREQSIKTAESIIKLSGLMRYVVTEADSEFVLLEKELDYVENYIELQRLRLDSEVKLVVEIATTSEGQMIAPLILIPFIENAFKHGVNPDEKSQIRIQIKIVDHTLTMDVDNLKVKNRLEHYEKSGHGIENVKSRLVHLYSGKHQLDIYENSESYHVKLSLQLS